MQGADKVWESVGDVPMIAHSIAAFAPLSSELVVVVKRDDHDRAERLLTDLGGTSSWRVVAGGDRRQDSVCNGLREVHGAEYVAVHDAARPLIRPELITRVWAMARESGAAVPALEVRDTLKRTVGGFVEETVDREGLWSIQTPQIFRIELLRAGYEQSEEAVTVTDDATLVEQAGARVQVVPGDPNNFKITTANDLRQAKATLRARERGSSSTDLRVGLGYDIHRLVAGRRLVLGGVSMEHSLGLEGHSDADVLLHAIMDALLGAAGLGDIGRHFPNTDTQWRDAYSLDLLKDVGALIKSHGLAVVNIDATVVAEEPHIAFHVEEMRRLISAPLEMDAQYVSIKATTAEGAGPEGRGEAISARAVALLSGN